MCGRYTLHTAASELAEAFGLDAVPDFSDRFNIAPTQLVPVVRSQAGHYEMDLLRWGLIPFWAKEKSIGNRMINARSESVAEKPAYRNSFKKKRCLVVADGFFEWKKTSGKKQPYYIHRRDSKPFAFAGLWDEWKGDAEPIESFTIITTDANELVAPLHDRMPVILPLEQYETWLDPDSTPAELTEILEPFPEEELETYPVSTIVNNPRNDVADCVEPIE